MDKLVFANQQKTHIHQFCVDTGYRLEDLLSTIDNRDELQERRSACLDIFQTQEDHNLIVIY